MYHSTVVESRPQELYDEVWGFWGFYIFCCLGWVGGWGGDRVAALAFPIKKRKRGGIVVGGC